MKADCRHTLMLPFEKGVLKPPGEAARWLFLNARPLPQNAGHLGKNLISEQGFRPDYLALQHQGYNCSPHLAGQAGADGAMVLASRVRRVSEADIARAWNAVRPGGIIMVAGDKTSGIQALRKWANRHAPVQGSLSKHHAVVFWLQRDDADIPVPDMSRVIEGYHVGAGMFSGDGPDPASQLLAQQFGPHIRGCVADFGAGWGYLSSQLLKRGGAVGSLALYEADHASLEFAKKNLMDFSDLPTSFYWLDVTTEFDTARFNWVIMNPPFHTGRAADPALGRQFIEKAAKALMPGGRLLMVANRQLPYEQTLSRLFNRVEKKAEKDGFKVIEATL